MFKDANGIFEMKAVMAMTKNKNDGKAIVWLGGNFPFQTDTPYDELVKGFSVDNKKVQPKNDGSYKEEEK